MNDLVAKLRAALDEDERLALAASATVDPAVPRRLASPVGEMLAWHRSEYERNECTLNADCPVHPGLAHDTAAS